MKEFLPPDICSIISSYTANSGTDSKLLRYLDNFLHYIRRSMPLIECSQAKAEVPPGLDVVVPTMTSNPQEGVS